MAPLLSTGIEELSRIPAIPRLPQTFLLVEVHSLTCGAVAGEVLGMEKPRRVLVTGATGYIGGRLAPRLVREGYSVRVRVRSKSRIEARPWADVVEVALGDVLDPSTLAPALEGIDCAFYLVHSMAKGRSGSGLPANERRLSEDRRHPLGAALPQLPSPPPSPVDAAASSSPWPRSPARRRWSTARPGRWRRR